MKADHILVVDDNPVNRELAVRQCERLGYSAASAASGVEALEILKKQKFQLVLMDCQMPGVDGHDTARAVRDLQSGEGKAIVIVALTASDSVLEREKCARSGMDDFLVKPAPMETLRITLNRWLGERPVPLAAVEPNPTLQAAGLGDPDVIQLLLETYQGQFEADVVELDKAVERGDYSRIARIAHSLRGASATLGFSAVTKSCIEIEDATREHDRARILHQVDRLRAANSGDTRHLRSS